MNAINEMDAKVLIDILDFVCISSKCSGGTSNTSFIFETILTRYKVYNIHFITIDSVVAFYLRNGCGGKKRLLWIVNDLFSSAAFSSCSVVVVVVVINSLSFFCYPG